MPLTKSSVKSKSPADRKEARRLDKEAKAANKAADKVSKLTRHFKKSLVAKQNEASAAASKTLMTKPNPQSGRKQEQAKQLKSAKAKLRMEAKSLKEMRDAGITDSRISAAASRVRNEKAKVEKLRNAAAKKSGKARPEKSTMTSRIAKEERDIRRQADKGNAKSKEYMDLKKRIQESAGYKTRFPHVADSLHFAQNSSRHLLISDEKHLRKI